MNTNEFYPLLGEFIYKFSAIEVIMFHYEHPSATEMQIAYKGPISDRVGRINEIIKSSEAKDNVKSEWEFLYGQLKETIDDYNLIIYRNDVVHNAGMGLTVSTVSPNNAEAIRKELKAMKINIVPAINRANIALNNAKKMYNKLTKYVAKAA